MFIHPLLQKRRKFFSAKTKKASEGEGEMLHHPHLATSPPSSGVHPAGSVRVAFSRPGGVSRPRPPPRALCVRRDSGMRTAEQPTFYDLLGISSEGTFEEVRTAYRQMARKYHPDVSLPDAAAENTLRFIEVHEAYETLSDPSRRATYDRALARGVCLLAFSAASRRASFYEDQEEKSGWRRSWEDQIAELKERSMRKNSEENLSWGARMRRRRPESSSAE